MKPSIRKVRNCISDAGGVAEVARALGVRYWAAYKWNRTGHVPVSVRWGNRAQELVDMANKAVGEKRWAVGDIRPDLFK